MTCGCWEGKRIDIKRWNGTHFNRTTTSFKRFHEITYQANAGLKQLFIRLPISNCASFGKFVNKGQYCTGKSLSETLLFAEHGENMLCTKIVLNVRNSFCTQHVLPRFELGIFMYWTCNLMSNLSSYCGLVDAKIRASDKDLPVFWS